MDIKARLHDCITQILAGNNPEQAQALGEEACRLINELTKENATDGKIDGVEGFASDPYRVGDRHES